LRKEEDARGRSTKINGCRGTAEHAENKGRKVMDGKAIITCLRIVGRRRGRDAIIEPMVSASGPNCVTSCSGRKELVTMVV
jgi:hypothetical protein